MGAEVVGVKGDKYRSHIIGEGEANTKWSFGAPPTYDVVNKLFEEDRFKVTTLFNLHHLNFALDGFLVLYYFLLVFFIEDKLIMYIYWFESLTSFNSCVPLTTHWFV